MKKLLFMVIVLHSFIFSKKIGKKLPAEKPLMKIKSNQDLATGRIPRKVSYQGLLTKQNGSAIKNGSYQLTFRFYSQLESGVSFWEESQKVNIDDGIINAVLGQSVPIINVPNQAYLEIEINGTILSPRQDLTTVFYSVVSDTANYSRGGKYSNLEDLPDLSVFVNKDTLSTFVKLDTLSNFVQQQNIDSITFSGDYSDLQNLPDLSNLSLDTLSNYTLTTDLNASLLALAKVDTLNNFQPKNNDLTVIANLRRLNVSNRIIISSDTTWISIGGDSARSALGLTIGADVQPYNEILDSLSSGSLSSSKVEHGEYLIDSEGESGQIWTSDGDGKGSWAFPLIGEADVVGINAGNGLLGGGDSGLVFLSVDVGSDSGQIVQLEGGGKLPALDGSSLLNVTAGDVAADNIQEGDGVVNLKTSSGAININPGSESAIFLDDILKIDDGNVTGAVTVNAEDFVASEGVTILGSGGIVLENAESITNLTNGTISINSSITSVSGDLNVQGNEIIFGNEEKISNTSNDTLKIEIANSNQIQITDGELIPVLNNDINLGSSRSEFKDLHLDGVAYLDAIGFGNTSLTIPSSDGSVNQVLRTDGSGSLSWSGIGAADSIKSDDIKTGDSAVNISTSSGSVTIDPASGSSVVLDGLSWPQSDGSAKQVLRTDGSGSLSWSGIGAADSIKSDDIKRGDATVNISTSAGSINVTPAPGSAIVLDGSVSIDSGAVTGATIVESENFIATKGVNINGTEGIIFENGESITNTADEKLVLNTPAAFISGDLNVTGNDIFFGNEEKISNTSNDTITVEVARSNQLLITDGSVIPGSDNDVDLGSTNSEYKDLYIDGVAYLDAIGMGTTVLALPSSDGQAKQVLRTDGSGSLSWSGIGAADSIKSDDIKVGDSAVNISTSSGSVTIDPATGSSLVLDGLSWPQSDGSAKQVLRTDGSGSLSWSGIGAADSIKSDDIKVGDSAVNISTSSGSVTIDPATGSSLVLDGLSWPQADGSLNQLLSTDGSGSLSWSTNTAATEIDGLNDAKSKGDNFSNSIIIGHETTGVLDAAENNVALGTTALDAITSGDGNSAIGYDALTTNSSGYNNTAFGANALRLNTSGIVNVAVGSSALDKNTTSNANTAVGHASSFRLSSGANNVTLGWESAKLLETGNNNVIIGAGSEASTAGGSTNQVVLGYNATGKGDNTVTLGNGEITGWFPSDDNEVDLGGSALQFKDLYVNGVAYVDALGFGNVSMALPASDGSANQLLTTDGSGSLSWATNSAATNIDGLLDGKSGGDNFTNSLILGHETTGTLSDAQNNVALGYEALDAITEGDFNTAIGNEVMSDNSTGEQNTASGYGALKSNVSGSYNSAFGYEALYINSNNGNSAFGWRSLRANTSGTYNSAAGYQSLTFNTEGNNNTALGYRSLYLNTITNNNTAIGAESLYDANRTADTDGYNTALGFQAGNTGVNDITTGNKNTLLGASTSASAATGSNQTVIGYGATGQSDNSVTIGNADVTAVYMSDDKGATIFASGLSLENDETITNSSDGTVLINSTVSAGPGSSSGIYQSNGDQNLILQTGNSTTGSITIIDGADANIVVTPNGSGAVIMDGLTWPTSDGSSNQILTTNGSGALSWSSSTGASDIDGLSDAKSGGDNFTSSLIIGHQTTGTLSSATANTAVGISALDAITSGDNNTAVGSSAMGSNTTGTANTGIGSASLVANTSGQVNTSVGYASLFYNSDGDWNTAIGGNSLFTNQGGDANVGVGYNALFSNTTGDNNIAIGAVSLYSNTTGTRNIAIGRGAYDSGDDENDNMAIGFDALGGISLNGAERNIAIGNYSLDAITSGDNNTALGYNALGSNTEGAANTAFGLNALSSVTTESNLTAIGYAAALNNTSGSGTVALGFSSLLSNNTGNWNTGIGGYSLRFNTSGARNTGVGYKALEQNTTSEHNTAVGYNALLNTDRTADTDGYNTGLGDAAGSNVTTGNKNTFLGANTSASAITGTNQTVVGYGASGQADNSVTLGDVNVTSVYMAQDKGATVYAASVASGGGGATGIYKSDGDYDVSLQTGNSTTGSITITDGANGDITLAPNGTGKTDFNNNSITGYGADLQTLSGTSKTLSATDNGTIIVCSSSSAVTITVPSSLPSGFNCMIIQSGSGQVSLSASSTTLNNRNGSKTAGQHAIMTIVHLGSDTFVVSGDTTS